MYIVKKVGMESVSPEFKSKFYHGRKISESDFAA